MGVVGEGSTIYPACITPLLIAVFIVDCSSIHPAQVLSLLNSD